MFFFINPEIADDPQLRHVNNVMLSNTLFQTDVDHEDDKDEEAGARNDNVGADEDGEQVAAGAIRSIGV